MQNTISKSIQIISILIVFLFSSLVSADVENEFSIEGTKIVVSESSNQEATITISSNNNEHKVTALVIENPTRIVFDIANLKPKTIKNPEINSELFKKVRLGLHSDKTRIVFDCVSNDLENITDLSQGNLFSFKISSNNVHNAPTTNTLSAKESKEKMNEQLATPTPTPLEKMPLKASPTKSATEIPTPIATAVPTIQPTAIPTKEPTKVATIEATAIPTPEPTIKKENPLKDLSKTESVPTTGKVAPEENETIVDVERKLQPKIEAKSTPVEIAKIASKNSTVPNAMDSNANSIIKSIVFQTTSEQMQSSMVIATSNPINYSINKISKSSYELIIPSAKLKGDHLKLPQFPPDSFKGFLFFHANEVEDGVVIKIEVEDNVNLSPYLAMGKLWIKAE